MKKTRPLPSLFHMVWRRGKKSIFDTELGSLDSNSTVMEHSLLEFTASDPSCNTHILTTYQLVNSLYLFPHL